jgi:hypothetical protein
MQTYKATNGVTSYLKNFADLAAAQAYFLPILGDKYTVTLASAGEQIPEKTEAQKLDERQVFGKQLLNDYLMDNDAIAKERGFPFTVEETAQQAQKFQLVMGILPLGSLKQSLDVISITATDTIFTQERKDKYIAALQNFILGQ